MKSPSPVSYVAIACGGTGGHLFPGMAVGEELADAGCEVVLLISQKEVDQEGVRGLKRMRVVTLPAVGLEKGNRFGFLASFWKSFGQARRLFRENRPDAVLAMGGFTSAPPILAGKLAGAATFLHESNAIPGRANRWLAPLVDRIFVGFDGARNRLRNKNVICTGTPVRPNFQNASTKECRLALGLDAEKQVLLVMGGSQGASAINDLALRALPLLQSKLPELQFIHLTGAKDFERVKAGYAANSRHAYVRAFCQEMNLVLGAATVAVSRAGASSLAEFGATGLPAILVPYPAAVDNHQWHNAYDLVEAGGAVMLQQASATPEKLSECVVRLMADEVGHGPRSRAITAWHKPDASLEIARVILAARSARVVSGPGHLFDTGVGVAVNQGAGAKQ